MVVVAKVEVPETDSFPFKVISPANKDVPKTDKRKVPGVEVPSPQLPEDVTAEVVAPEESKISKMSATWPATG